MAIAVACAGAMSTVLFLVASDVEVLVAARVVSGMAAGFATGTATAALAELQPRGDHRAAAVVASGSNMTGLGLGPLTAGLFAEYVAMPTHSVFWAYLGLCGLALAALSAVPETVRNGDWNISLRPRIAVPPAMRTVMLGAGLGVFAAFSVLGLFSSLVPTFLHVILGVHNFVLVGGASFLIFVIAAISQAVSAALPSRRSVSAGLPLLLVCLAGLESALFTGERGSSWRPPSRAASRWDSSSAAAWASLTGLLSLVIGPPSSPHSSWPLTSALACPSLSRPYLQEVGPVTRVPTSRVWRLPRSWWPSSYPAHFGVAAAPTTPCTPSDSWCHPRAPDGLSAGTQPAAQGAHRSS